MLGKNGSEKERLENEGDVKGVGEMSRGGVCVCVRERVKKK